MISKKYIYSISFIVSFLILSPSLNADSIDWRLAGAPISEHFDTMEISQNPQNFRIKQDSLGYIYIGNGSGILMFDGVNWQKISYGNQKPFRDFVLSDDGKIYTGTQGYIGFFQVDEQNKWSFTSLLDGLKDVPENNAIYRVFQKNKYIYYTSRNYLFYYHPDHGMRWIKKSVYDLVNDGDSLILALKDGSLANFDPELGEIKTIKLAIEISPYIYGFTVLETKEILAFTHKNFYFHDRVQGLKLFRTEIDSWLSDKLVTTVTQLSADLLAVGTLNNGVAVIDLSGKLHRYYTTSHDLKTDMVSFLFVDREKNLWVSSHADGVTRAELNSPISYFSSEEEQPINNVLVNYKDKLIVGGMVGLFELVQAKTLIEQAKLKKIELDIDGVFSLLVDDDKLLVGHSFGIDSIFIDEEGKYQSKTIHNSRLSKGYDIRLITRSKFDKNIIYVGTNEGLLMLKKTNGNWDLAGFYPQIEEEISSVVENSLGDLWIGTIKGNFYYLRELKSWPNIYSRKLDISSNQFTGRSFILSIDEHLIFKNDPQKNIETYTHDGFNLQSSDIANWEDNGINNIVMLTELLNKRAWFLTKSDGRISSKIGEIVRIDKNHYEFDFSRLDHLKLQFTQGLYYSDDGILWITARGRVNRFDTKIKTSEIAIQKPFVTSIVSFGDDKELYSYSLSRNFPDPFILQPNQNSIRVFFSSAEFQHRKMTEYRFRSTDSGSWSEWGEKTNAELKNLKAGIQQFDIQYRFNAKDLSPITRITLNRLPFWYQSWWGKLSLFVVAVLLIASLSLVYVRYKFKKLNKQASNLKQKVLERTEYITKQNEQLKQAGEAKTRFFTNISHEFRTPLTLSIGPLQEVLKRGNLTNVDDKNDLLLALKNNHHMTELIDQVLDLNKLEAGKMPVKLSKIDLPQAIRYCFNRFRISAKKRNLSFDLIHKNKNCFLFFDSEHLEKILMNLISNAIKHSPDGCNVEIKIELGVEEVAIQITDCGSGISKEDIPYVFDRFYQGKNSSNTLQRGTGIGLAIVKELAKFHGGDVSICEEANKGACFMLVLPVLSQHFNEGKVEEYKVESKFDEAYLSQLFESNQKLESDHKISKKILIIDDNEELRLFVKSVLQSAYIVLDAANGQEGLETAKEMQPDVIISDVMMPVMDGFELAKALKDSIETDYIPLILLTAKTTKRDTVKGFEQGANDYLTKPFDSAELVARVGAQIAQTKRMADKLKLQYPNFIKSHQNSIKTVVANKRNFQHSVKVPNKFSQQLDCLLAKRIVDEEFDVNKMWQEMNTTRSTLFRNVRDYYQSTPVQLLKLTRLKYSLKLLTTESGSISEIAYASGFKNLSCFSRAFKEVYQVPPTRFHEII